MKINEKFIMFCVETFDTNMQPVILIEEMSELQKEICKAIRSNNCVVNRRNLIEEITHVLISINVICKIYGIQQYDINKEVEKKQEKYKFFGSED